MDVQEAAMKQCINSDGSETLSECPPLQASVDPYFNWNGPERPPVVNERVRAWLDKLLAAMLSLDTTERERPVPTVQLP